VATDTATSDVAVREVPKNSAEGVPTRKGLTLRPETWAALLPAIEAVLGMGPGDDDGDG